MPADYRYDVPTVNLRYAHHFHVTPHKPVRGVAKLTFVVGHAEPEPTPLP